MTTTLPTVIMTTLPTLEMAPPGLKQIGRQGNLTTWANFVDWHDKWMHQTSNRMQPFCRPITAGERGAVKADLQDRIQAGVSPVPHRAPAMQCPEDVPGPLPVLLLAGDPPEVEEALHGLWAKKVMRILHAI